MKKIMFVIALLFVGLTWGCGNEKPAKKDDPFKVEPLKEIETPIEDATSTTEEVVEEEPEVVSIPMAPEQIEKAKEIIAAIPESDVAAVDAQGKYKLICSACHGKDGRLNVAGAKDLSKSRISLEEIVAQVYFGKGLMPPWKGALNDTEIIAVAKYIKTLRK